MKGRQVSIAQTRNLTFIDTVISRSRVSDIALVLAGVVLVALSAQVELYVPPVPVPFTLQTLAVLLIGATYGAARGAVTLSAYAFVGLIGFPVFTNGGSGLGVLFGATGGFIIGFIFAAALIGKLAELKWSSNIVKMIASYVLSSIVIYSIGIAVLAMVAYSSDLQKAFTVMIPFLAWDAVKAVMAGALLPSAWALVKAVKK
jgi:biotin transport system substrate-specific component